MFCVKRKQIKSKQHPYLTSCLSTVQISAVNCMKPTNNGVCLSSARVQHISLEENKHMLIVD